MLGLSVDLDTVRGGERILRVGQTGDQLIGVMLVITIAAAIGFVGVDVGDQLDESVQIENSQDNNESYEDAKNNLSTGFADAMGLTDIVFLVLMFSVILGALLTFRQ